MCLKKKVVEGTTFQQVSSVCDQSELSPICKSLKLNKGQRHSALQKKKIEKILDS